MIKTFKYWELVLWNKTNYMWEKKQIERGAQMKNLYKNNFDAWAIIFHQCLII